MTWKALKEFCNALAEDNLENKVILQREGEAITDIYAECFEEDQLLNTDLPEDGFISRSTMWSLIRDYPEDYLDKENHFKVLYKSETPMLFENF